MIIGFGFDNFDGPIGDREVLESIGCDRVFSEKTIDNFYGFKELNRIVELLRPGDILAVVNLNRLGEDVESVISLVAKLHDSGIKVRAEQNGITPDSPVWEGFGESCAVLSKLANSLAAERVVTSDRPGRRRRGRPVTVTNEVRGRAERLLNEGHLTVADVARLLKVSTATVYRWFPGRTMATIGPQVSRRSRKIEKVDKS